MITHKKFTTASSQTITQITLVYCFFTILLISSLKAQVIQMVQDIASGATGSDPNRFTLINGIMYFQANDGTNGYEFWKYDGINPPEMIADIFSGSSGSFAQQFTALNSKIVFRANNGTNGHELWEYDGINPPGMVMDINPGISASAPASIINLNGLIVFQATTANDGIELWKYDGINPSSLVSDIRSGTSSSTPDKFYILNNTLYFQATDGTQGIELWKYDGSNPPAMVSDINPGSSSSSPDNFSNIGDTLYFSATDGTNGIELWKYDGVNPPSMAADIISGSSSSSPLYLTNINNVIYFRAGFPSAGTELGKYDGINPPFMVADIIPGVGSSSIDQMTNANGILYFRVNGDGTNGAELWKYDGISAPAMVADINPGSNSSNPSYITYLNGKIYFVAGEPTKGTEIWMYDGINPPANVTDINSAGNSTPLYLTIMNGSILFQASDGTNGTELWKLTPCNDISAFTVSDNPNCTGETNGSATATVSGGTSPFTYLWSDGQNSANATGLGAGVYTVTVTDVNSCTGSANVTLVTPAVVDAGATRDFCKTQIFKVKLTGSPAGGTWSASGGVVLLSGDTLDVVNTPVTVTSGIPHKLIYTVGACSDTANLFISGANAGVDMDYCVKDGIFTLPLASPAGGTWTGNGVVNALTGQVDPTGLSGTKTYTYTHTGCPDEMLVNYFPALGIPVVSCGISSPTSITWNWTTVPGATSYEINFGFGWNSPSSGSAGLTHTVAGLVPGDKRTIQVHAIRTGTCTEIGTASTPVECEPVPCIPFTVVTIPDQLKCPSEIANIGLLSILRQDGLGKFIWEWSGDPALIDNMPGPFTVTTPVTKTYYVTVTDTSQLACPSVTDSAVVTVSNITAVTTQKNISCFGGNDGSAKVTVSGVAGPFTYDWSPDNETIDSINNKIAGVYSCIIKMVNDPKCQITKSVIITEPPQLLADAGLDDSVKCGSLVNLDGDATGGTSPYTFSWNNGVANQFNNNVAFGTYILSVTDKNGCVATDTVTVFDVPTTLTVTNMKVVVCNGQTDTGTVNISGGTPPYTYQWDSGDITPTITKPAGTYFVTVRDMDACVKPGVMTVHEMAPLVISAGSDQVVQCGGTATITGTVTSGTGPLTIRWDSNGVLNASVTGLIYSNADTGIYTLTVSDSLECSVSDQAEVVEEISTLTISTLSTKTTCQSCNDGTATANVSGGVTPYSYQWNSAPPQTSATASGLISGNYSVTVTDANGCVQTNEVFVDFVTGSSTAKLMAENITIYPNPVTQNLTVEINNPDKTEIRLALYNLLGQQIDHKIFTEGAEKITTKYDHEIFAEQVYMLKISIGNRVSYYRVVVVR